MTRTFRYRIKPNRGQQSWLSSLLAACCILYNVALEQRILAYRRQHKSLSLYDQQKELTELRKDDPSFRQAALLAYRSALSRLHLAFQAFFSRVRKQQKPGFPRFRSRDRYNSVSFLGTKGWKLDANRLFLSGLEKPIFIHLHRPIQGRLLALHIRRDGDRWWACVICGIGEAPEKRVVSSATGIDLGISSYATLSDGSKVENPKFYEKGVADITRCQQRVVRRRKGSNRRREAKRLLDRAWEKLRNQQDNFLHILSRRLVERFDLIAHEKLEIREMVEGDEPRSLHRRIMEAGWHRFLFMLSYKGEETGCWVVPVNPRGTTKQCSSCGKDVPKELWERTHRCTCGLTMGRDHNTALNILRLGQSRQLSAANSQ